jgi:hypothetical protein
MRDAFAEAIGLTNVVDPRQRPAPRQRPGSSPRRGRQRNTRRPKDAFEEAITPSEPQQQAEPVQQAPEQPVEQAPAAPAIDFDAPVPEVRKAIDALPKEQQQAAIDEWAKRYVAKERKENEGWGQIAQDRIRDLARGTPVGSWLDEANAATSAALHSVGLGGAPYRESVAYQRAQDEAADNESTKLATLPVIGDVHTSGVTKVLGGLGITRAVPMVNVLRGGTIIPQVGNAMATGLAYGTLYGAGEGKGVEERAVNATIGGGAGAAFGAAVPLAMQGGKAVANAMTPKRTPKAVSKYHPGATNRLVRSVGDDLVSPGGSAKAYAAQAGRLGEKGMLLDMGSNLIGQADAIANQPGRGKALVRGALRARDRDAPNRIHKVVNDTLGQASDFSESGVQGVLRIYREKASPLYKKFENTPVEITPTLRKIMNRIRALAPNIDETIAKRMFADDVSPDVIANNGAVLNYMKRAMDAMAKKAAQEGDNGLVKTARGLAKELRDEVDTILSPGNPKESIYAKAREESRRGLSFEKGYKDGKTILNNATSFDEMRLANKKRTPDELAGLRYGAREDIRKKMYTARSAFDETSRQKAQATAGRRHLSSDETRAKIGELVGNYESRDLVRTLDAEGQMAGVSNAIQGNSATAGRQAAQKEFPNAVAVNAGDAANELGKKNLGGLTMEAGYRILNFLSNGWVDESRRMIAEDAAEMLVAQGLKRDEIAAALIQLAQREIKSDAGRKAVMGLAQGILRGGAPSASREAIENFNG